MILISVALLVSAYFTYARFLARRYELDDNRPTPSHTDYDGIDRVPAHRFVLLGHHFSSIAGAAPIVGPIIAAVAFGWLPVLLWVVIGSIFIGGVHDFSALVSSIRHRGRSIAEITREHMSPTAYRLFLVFIWLTLVYVITVFTDLTATTFVQDGGVATSSLLYIGLAILFGLTLNRLKVSLLRATLLFVPLVFLAIGLGQEIPLSAERVAGWIGGDPKKTWSVILVAYCFIASTTPVWILLQPRDYLSSFLLYASVLAGLVGVLLGGFAISMPAVTAWTAPIGSLFPILFITVACGACSGFHSIVASGTSSKQLNKETDAKLVGYGGMLLEGVVAVIALCTVAMLPGTHPLLAHKPVDPLQVYSAGMGRFVAQFGLSERLGSSFGLLALSAFILTTLDTATRLGRYIFEEFFNFKSTAWRYLSTLATLALPTVFVLITLRDAGGHPTPAWKAIWPVFGASNQLLAGLVLLVVAIWLWKLGKNPWFVVAPMLFMNVMTLWALVLLLGQYRFSAVGMIAGVLLLLALILLVEAYRTVRRVVGAVQVT